MKGSRNNIETITSDEDNEVCTPLLYTESEEDRQDVEITDCYVKLTSLVTEEVDIKDNLPNERTFYAVRRRVPETGYLQPPKERGIVRRALTVNVENHILQIVENDSTTSICRIANTICHKV
ncbi:hypothetical protein ILUMI_08809 [Ignelater luminosus]|uniref:Uncharacterized protein n=1 Tax=Ignelater luminosus TaxID=2038154 RepID=A0A8K0D6Y8_IGNLU|nr:hypothetical protein ILUMI_08809 [Ignelater luminosus]